MVNPVFDEQEDRERRKQLAAFLQAKRQSVDLSAKQIGTYVRRANRIGRQFTQEEVAEALSISRQWYAALELGASVRPSTGLIDRIASLFHLSDNERMMLFRLGIREFSATNASPNFEARSPGTPFAWAVSSPSDIHTAARALAETREHYNANGMMIAASARPRIFESWERCRRAGVDPDLTAIATHRESADLRTQNERLLRAAGPALVQLVSELTGTGYAIILTDAHGYVLTISGDVPGRQFCSRARFESGANMSEAVAGTNAIGTAIADQRPLQMVAAEHFCEAFVSFTCTASPIYAPSSHDLVGVLDISGPYKLVRPHLMAVVMQAALEIEEQLAML